MPYKDPEKARAATKKAWAKYGAKHREYLATKSREYHHLHPEVGRESKLKQEYGITTLQYNEMLADQLWGCAMCGRTNKNGKRLAVDHDHITGEVRALLCSSCNQSLGHYEKIKIKAEKYLESYNGER